MEKLFSDCPWSHTDIIVSFIVGHLVVGGHKHMHTWKHSHIHIWTPKTRAWACHYTDLVLWIESEIPGVRLICVFANFNAWGGHLCVLNSCVDRPRPCASEHADARSLKRGFWDMRQTIRKGEPKPTWLLAWARRDNGLPLGWEDIKSRAGPNSNQRKRIVIFKFSTKISVPEEWFSLQLSRRTRTSITGAESKSHIVSFFIYLSVIVCVRVNVRGCSFI